uniref:Putative secreted peptide n=1 Tax=Anopheles braziliensis TaxID=58242 RepID=A0A2M3ZXA3_9DIPT
MLAKNRGGSNELLLLVTCTFLLPRIISTSDRVTSMRAIKNRPLDSISHIPGIAEQQGQIGGQSRETLFALT